jgi:endonuclease/exonuclease/phosphatase family metal-dependent hydrolase
LTCHFIVFFFLYQRFARRGLKKPTDDSSTSNKPEGDPYVYVGDFNVQPDSNMYRLLTKGAIEDACPDKPPMSDPQDDWQSSVAPMKSAYLEVSVVVVD